MPKLRLKTAHKTLYLGENSVLSDMLSVRVYILRLLLMINNTEDRLFEF